MKRRPPIAVVLVSGGLDSATTLAIAQRDGFDCRALTFDYGQRHRSELAAATAVAQSMNLTQHVRMKIDLRAFGGSALTADIDVPKASHSCTSHGGREASHIPVTYVPARNTIFLSFALAFAETLHASDVYIGVNAVDYSGYPDCRSEFIDAFANMANLATRMGMEGHRFHIHTPLIHLSKADIITQGVALGVDYSLTTSCYDPDAKTGQPCGECDSCTLRAAGFKAAGLVDPLLERFGFRP